MARKIFAFNNMFKTKLRYRIIVVCLTLIIVLGNNLISFAPTLSLALVDVRASSAEIIETSNTNFISQQTILEEKHPALLEDAQLLTAEGHKKLSIGDAHSAFKYWQQAREIYQQQNDKEGLTGSLINQSLALQALGRSRRSCKVLVSAFKSDSQICEPSNQLENPHEELHALIQTIEQRQDNYITFLGLHTLGDILRVVGNLEESEIVLNCIINKKYKYSNYDISTIFLSLGNTQRFLYNKTKDLSEKTESSTYKANALKKAQEALKTYQQVSQSFDNKNIATHDKKLYSRNIQAKINILSLLLDLKQWELQLEKVDTFSKKLDFSQREIKLLMNEFQKEVPDFSKLTPVEEIYARLNFVRSLIQLKGLNIPEFSDRENELTLLALNEAKNAVLKAKSLKIQRLEAYSIGSLGYIYEQADDFKSAKKLTEQALIIAQSIAAQDIAYQLQWQLARIYDNQKNIGQNIEKAKQAYDASVKTLDSVRQDLLALNQDIEFSFSKDVEPVYEEYIDLLLRQDINQNKLNKKCNRLNKKCNANLDNLDKIAEVTSSLQLARVQSFLRCGSTVFSKREPVENIAPVNKAPAAIIYPIFIKDRLEIILRIPQLHKLKRYSVEEFSSTTFTETVNFLKVALSNKGTDIDREIKPYAQKLYDWLIKPIELDLPKSGTLVFVLDRNLQNIPLAVLHDKNQYLIQKYSIAISLGSELPNSTSLSSEKWKVLLAGVSSEKADSFKKEKLSALPDVKNELEKIKSIVRRHKRLLDKQFTRNIFKSQFNIASFPIVHIATHATFSSDPEKTRIYAWDNPPIKLNELNNLFQTRVKTSKGIELLVLSACETAAGDKQAALGIAGVALKSEVRSIVASLWKVNDASTAIFMKTFYQKLKLKHGLNKAEALRKAQMKLAENPHYKHPYFWAPFIIVGNWL